MSHNLRRLLRLILLTLLSTPLIAQSTQVFALEQGFYEGNKILYYDPDACEAGTSGGGSASLVGNDNAERIWNFLVGNDGNLSGEERLSPEQAAGVMGNIYEETLPKFDPKSEERSGGGGYGIVQWTAGRRTALENAARQQGVDVGDLGFQLKFMYEESKSRTVTARDFKSQAVDNNEWKTLQSLDSIEDAALFWHQNFEISADSLSAIQERVTAGKNIFEQYKDKTPSDNQAGGSSSGCSSFTGGDLKATLLAYAWPDRRSNSTPNAEIPTEAYRTAIQKAQQEGQYVGGPPPGIDCGAFITRLMIDSGYEPEYNYSGKGGNTTIQEEWLRENWEFLGNGGDVNTGDLRLGDVAVKGGSGAAGHTFVYVGDELGPDFKSDTASASLGQRAPTAAFENPTDASFNWYRKK